MTDETRLLLSGVEVSRETMAQLDIFVERVKHWTTKINLISPGTVSDLCTRHLLDSAQLFPHLRSGDRLWADIGSGGGFPGLVVAILARELRPGLQVVLVESDRRKATFLRMIGAEMNLLVTVHAARIQEIPPLGADIVSARALAPLDVLLGMAIHHLGLGGMALFPKGESYRDEIATARKTWHFDVEDVPSVTQDRAALLKIKDIRRA
jgi:16S rRNA (guanine527-N7)-methyltransferase